MYEDKTPEKIKADIINALNTDRENLWDTREGSFADDQSGPMALELSKVYNSLNEARFIAWPDETSGPYIDLAVDAMGIEPRKQGTKAKADLQITGTAGFIIPQGKYFVSTDNLNFITIRESFIPDSGVVIIEVEAENIGASYNVPADTITQQFSNDAEITAVTNPLPASGATDPESDKSLFARLDLARKKPRTSANKHHYEEWAVEVDGVETVRVFPCRFGRGTVMVLIADANRRPVDQAIIDACETHINEEMPCGGIELTVKTPTEISVSISTPVKLDGTVSIEQIRLEFIDKINSYFSQISLESDVVIHNRIGALLIGIIGVKDYPDSDLLLNEQAGNLQISDEQVPVLGEVVLTPWI